MIRKQIYKCNDQDKGFGNISYSEEPGGNVDYSKEPGGNVDYSKEPGDEE